MFPAAPMSVRGVGVDGRSILGRLEQRSATFPSRLEVCHGAQNRMSIDLTKAEGDALIASPKRGTGEITFENALGERERDSSLSGLRFGELGAEPDLVVTLIHGTYAHDASWVKETSTLSTALIKAFRERLEIKPFPWSGGNSLYDRWAAAEGLCDHIEKLRVAHPHARQFLVAHSHGGNVACYALQGLSPGHNVSGLACLATPFLHARVRDTEAFKAENWKTAVFGFIMLLLWVTGVTTRHGWWWFIVPSVIASFVGIVAGAILEHSLKAFSGSAKRMADLATARVSSEIDLLIIRAVGDEASLLLGTSQFLSWVTSKAFTHFSAGNKKGPFGLHFKRRPLPRGIIVLWWLTIPVLILAIGLSAVHPDIFIRFNFWLIAIFGSAALSTVVWKTNWFDHLLYGVVLVSLTIATVLGIISVGTVPNDATEVGGRFARGWIGAMHALLVEINTV